MANKTKDNRVVNINVTTNELVSLIGEKALDMGIIDFTPDTVEVINQGNDTHEIVFTKDTLV